MISVSPPRVKQPLLQRQTPVVLQEVFHENNETKRCLVKDNDIHSKASHQLFYTVLFCTDLYPELSCFINQPGRHSERREEDIFLTCRWEVVGAEWKACSSSSLHSAQDSLTRGVVASFSFPFSSTFVRGADGFLEAPVPKWVLEFKITHFSKREPPPQAKGENGPFFFQFHSLSQFLFCSYN